jgi:hypothetical protein
MSQIALFVLQIHIEIFNPNHNATVLMVTMKILLKIQLTVINVKINVKHVIIL